jgi:hypothetical protein
MPRLRVKGVLVMALVRILTGGGGDRLLDVHWDREGGLAALLLVDDDL